MGNIVITRVDLVGDNPATNGDQIIINDPTTGDSKSEAAVIDGEMAITSADGLAENQTANQELSDLQPLGKNERTYQLPIKIYLLRGTGDNGVNSIISKLETWDEESKNNDNWKEGRFSIIIDDCVPLSRIAQKPVGDLRGLMLVSVNWRLSWVGNPPYAKATLTFKESRGDGS